MARHALAEIAGFRYVTLAEASKASADAVRDRLLHLLKTPKDRNLRIMEWFLSTGHARLANDMGQDMATTFYSHVAELVLLTVEKLHSVEVRRRDNAWYEAESILFAACKRQAFIEFGGAAEAIATGLEQGADRRRLTKGMSIAELKGMDYDVKGAIKEARSEG